MSHARHPTLAVLAVGALLGGRAAAAPPRSAEDVRHDIEVHLGSTVQWVEVRELFLMQHESCVDGRDDHGILGTPGGDTGELVLALAAVESVAKRPLLDRQVDGVVAAELQALNEFYLHTDTHALQHLRDALAEDPKTATYAERLQGALPAPPPKIQDEVIEQLVKPHNVGCGHLKLILQHGHEYGVRPGLVRAVLRAIYRRYFAGDPSVSFVVLDGSHEEEAVVQVTVPGPLTADSRIPILVPKRSGTQLFVQHPQVADFVRAEEVQVLLEQAPWLVDLEVTKPLVLRHMKVLAARQLDETLRRLAGGLPIYEVRFDRAGGHRTVERGAVPGAAPAKH